MTTKELIDIVLKEAWYRNNREKIKSILDEFFSQNVVIPKGKNRHPYADVLHEWLEGVVILSDSSIDGIYSGRILEHCSLILDDRNYRIKPQEQVYEYKYAIWYCNKRFISEHYLTKDEFDVLNTQQTVELLEETKRVRQ